MADPFEEELAKRRAGDPFERELARRKEGFAPLRAVGEAVTGAASSVAQAVRGEKGPGFEDVGGLDLSGIKDPEVLSAINRAKVGAPDDKRFGELVKQALGPRVFRVEPDEVSGQEVVTFQDDAGNLQRGFINEPGLDVEDVSRGIQSSLPFLAAGGAVGVGVRGAGLLARAAAQTAGQAGASLGQDIAAGEEGQRLSNIDPFKLAVSALGGAGGELTFAAFQALRNIFPTSRNLVDPETGGLTERGVAMIERAGIDPDAVTPEFLVALQAPDISRTGDQVQAIIRAEMDQFGIPSTAGARTLDPELLSVEQTARKGLSGRQAQDVATEFDLAQRLAVGRAQQNVAAGLGGAAGARTPSTPGEAGEAILRGLTTAEETAESAISRAFQEVDVGKVFPTGIPKRAFDDLGTRISAELGPLRAGQIGGDTSRFPSATGAVQFLQDFSEGKLRKSGIPLLRRGQPGRVGPLDFDTVRREVNTFVNTVKPGTEDFAASVAVKRAYNDWIENLAKTALKNADVDEFMKLQGAIGLTAKTRQLFRRQGKDDVAGGIIRKILDQSDSPEGVVRELFGAGLKGAPKKGSVAAAQRMKTILQKEQPDAWHAVRQAYWNRLSKKEILSTPGNLDRRTVDTALGQVSRNINEAFENQRSLLNVLYTPQELRQMKAFGQSMKRAQAMDLNPSGTAFEAQRFRNAAKDTVSGNYLKRRAASSMLAKQPGQAMLYRIMGKRLQTIFGERGAVQEAKRAGRLFSPELPGRRQAPSAGRGGAIAVQEAERER